MDTNHKVVTRSQSDTQSFLNNVSQKYSHRWNICAITMRYFTSTQQDQCSTLLESVGSQDLSDVTFAVGEDRTEFHLNRVFLAIISPVFKAMLYGHMQEAQPMTQITIDDITPDVFECLIHFAYCSDPKITSQNVLFVLTACDKYQITKLQEVCYEFFKRNLSSSNFINYYYTAVSLGFRDETVVKTLERFFAKHYKDCLSNTDICLFFDDVVQSDHSNFVLICKKRFDEIHHSQIYEVLESLGFLSMSLKSMRLFLKRSIDCKEEVLWTALLQWVRHQAQNEESDDDSKSNLNDGEKTSITLSEGERSLLKSVKDSIRFTLMDGKYFSNQVIPTNALSDKEVISVLRYCVYPEGGCDPFNTTSRKIPTDDLCEHFARMNHTFKPHMEYHDGNGKEMYYQHICIGHDEKYFVSRSAEELRFEDQFSAVAVRPMIHSDSVAQ